MDNPIKLTALYSEPLTPRAQLFSDYPSLLRACLCLAERLPGSFGKCLWLIRAIFSESWGNGYSSVSAVAVPNRRLSERWVGEGSLGHVGITHCPGSALLRRSGHTDRLSLFPSLSPWTCTKGRRTSMLEVVRVRSAWMLWQRLLLCKDPTFGGSHVKRDLVPKCVDVHLGHASPWEGTSARQ